MWADGSKYEGEFKDNNIHGKGIRPKRAKESMSGAMGEGTTETGLTTKWTGRGCSRGLMGGSTRENTLKTKNRDSEFLSGILKQMKLRPDGRRYEGCWMNGKQDGRGVYISHNGEEKQGEWKDGKRVRWLSEAEH